MVHKDAGFLRKIRLGKIAKAIAAGFNEGGIPYEKLLIMIQFDEGLTRERVEEYVDLVLKVKGWILYNGKIIAELPEES